MEHHTFSWTVHNTDFFGQYWKADNAKAIVAIVHGMGEHSSRYADTVVPFLNKAGYSVIAYDHFGHGKTKGKRGHNPGFEAVLDSISTIIGKGFEFLGNDLPLFLYGHSMGGNAVANYILKRNDKRVKGAIISSPMLKLAFDPPAWKMAAAKVMKNIYPAFQESTGLDSSAISRDKTEVDKYNNDPLVHDKITVNFSLPFFEAGDWAIEHANELNIPVFMIHGTADRLTDYKGTEAFAAKTDKATLKLYEGGYHELHNDIVKDEVLNDIVAWLNQPL